MKHGGATTTPTAGTMPATTGVMPASTISPS
jgi:hypothetical protein